MGTSSSKKVVILILIGIAWAAIASFLGQRGHTKVRPVKVTITTDYKCTVIYTPDSCITYQDEPQDSSFLEHYCKCGKAIESLNASNIHIH